MGEELVLFRSPDGRYGLVAEHCSDRGHTWTTACTTLARQCDLAGDPRAPHWGAVVTQVPSSAQAWERDL